MRAQKKLSYNEYVRKNEIRSRIENLKKNFTANQELIFELERDLGRIIDNELRDRMMDLKVFDCLHAEKATSHFLNLAKKTSKGESETRVRNMHGTWGRHGLNNQLRVYALKYYNNILGLSNRVAHFVPNTDTRCIFCVLDNREII